MRFYPTDLLLTVEHAEEMLTSQARSDLSVLLAREGLTSLVGLFRSPELAAALDELLGGINQYPWQYLIDTNDVCEHSPIGTIVIDDHRPGNTLRGLLLGWATGNHVVLRSPRSSFWKSLVDLLRMPGVPLPEAHVIGDNGAAIGALPIDVPDVVPVLPAGAKRSCEWTDEALYAQAASDDRESVYVRVPVPGHDPCYFAGRLLAHDCQLPWVQRLFRRKYLVGTTLEAARAQDVHEQRSRIDAKLRYLIGRARHAPYYRDLPTICGLAALDRLPVLEKDNLERHSLPGSRDLSTDGLSNGQVLRSGGTSGTARYVAYSRADWTNMVREAIPVLYALGLAPGDRVINTLVGGRLYGGMITTVCELSRMPLECYTTGQHISVNDVLTLVESFSANAFLGQPALMLPLLRDAKARAPELQIEKVIYGGTPMTESDKAWLREQLGTRVISSILAANDGAQLGYQCAELGGALHHLIPDFNLIEVVDDDGNRMAPGDPGDLLITSLQKFEGPLIRYRIGDRGRILHHDCGCGISGEVLEYLGRSDQQIKIMGRRMLHSELLDALAPFQVSQLQAEVISSGQTETLILRTESRVPLDPGEVRSYLTSSVDALGDVELLPTDVQLFNVVVECHPEGSLPRTVVSGKVVPVIDRRLG